ELVIIIIIIISIFLCSLSISDPVQTKCQLVRSQVLEARTLSSSFSPSSAVFVPECSSEGHFLPTQCHNQTGYCWCSMPDGKPVSGTTVLHVVPNCTGQTPLTCERERSSLLSQIRSAFQDERFIPECTADGRYSPVQCHSATGYCWCVRVDSGRPLPGTSARILTCSLKIKTLCSFTLV
uniref:Thyroglobulin type-1 domain-containing protein n=1 Tax=Amphiprion percula TaxID=161767 RepID=A0A3P8TND0_AMPPE